jgi:hypothetical protein
LLFLHFDLVVISRLEELVGVISLASEEADGVKVTQDFLSFHIK